MPATPLPADACLANAPPRDDRIATRRHASFGIPATATGVRKATENAHAGLADRCCGPRRRGCDHPCLPPRRSDFAIDQNLRDAVFDQASETGWVPGKCDAAMPPTARRRPWPPRSSRPRQSHASSRRRCRRGRCRRAGRPTVANRAGAADGSGSPRFGGVSVRNVGDSRNRRRPVAGACDGPFMAGSRLSVDMTETPAWKPPGRPNHPESATRSGFSETA